MTFNEVMALIMPSILAMLFYSKIIRKKITFWDGLCHAVVFMLIINSICYAILIYLNKTQIFTYTDVFTLKYSVMAVCAAIVVVIVYRFLELNIGISLRVKHKDEEN